MPRKGHGFTAHYVAWDTSANAGKTGDVANHTIQVVKGNSAPAAATNSPAEVDATKTPGLYKITITDDENADDFVTIAGVSSTGNVSIMPVCMSNILDLGYSVVAKGAGTLTALKAMEILLAMLAGRYSYNTATGVLTAYAYDGTTQLMTIGLLGQGDRNAPTIL